MSLDPKSISMKKYFAWFPTKVGRHWVWLETYIVGYETVKEPHYCHDCVNPLAPCGIGIGTIEEYQKETYRVRYRGYFQKISAKELKRLNEKYRLTPEQRTDLFKKLGIKEPK